MANPPSDLVLRFSRLQGLSGVDRGFPVPALQKNERTQCWAVGHLRALHQAFEAGQGGAQTAT